MTTTHSFQCNLLLDKKECDLDIYPYEENATTPPCISDIKIKEIKCIAVYG